MRIRVGYQAGAGAKYKDVRGPDGSRYLAWRWGLGERHSARFGYEAQKDGTVKAPSDDDRRRMRNARKQERREARHFLGPR